MYGKVCEAHAQVCAAHAEVYGVRTKVYGVRTEVYGVHTEVCAARGEGVRSAWCHCQRATPGPPEASRQCGRAVSTPVSTAWPSSRWS